VRNIVLRNRERVTSLSFPEGQTDIDTWEHWEKLDGGSALWRRWKELPEL